MADKDKKKPTTSKLPALAKNEKPAVAPGVSSALQNVEVKVTVEFGRTQITVEEALKLAEKSVLAMDKMQNELFDVCVNGQLFGRGKLVMIGETYGSQLVELIEQG